MHETEYTDRIYTIDELKQLLTPIFEKAPIYKAVLFGSYARGDAKKWSDLDIVVDSGGRLRGISVFGVRGEIEDAVNKRVDFFDTKYMSRATAEFLSEINKGVTIYERQQKMS